MYSLNFAPELTGIGKYSGEMAAWLAARGHDVRVVTAPPYYPEWRIHSGFRDGWYAAEEWRGVSVTRCPIWIPQRVTGLRRLLHLASFAASSLPALLAQVLWRPDIIWVVEPTLFCAPAALTATLLARSRSWLHIQDFEIDAAFSMGLLRGGHLRRTALWLERWILQRFDFVSSISGRMLELAEKKGVAPERLFLFPNWVDVRGVAPLNGVSGYRALLGIGDKDIVALYSGNMGAKQGLDVLAEAALELRSESSIYFVFCGDGPGKKELESRCSGLRNVRMLPLQPSERLNELLGLADIHLLPQRADAADLVLPSKLTGMLASGRPVIATADADTELGRVINGSCCGRVVTPGCASELAEAIRQMSVDIDTRRAMGAAGRAYAQRELDLMTILGRFEQHVQRVHVQ